MGKIKAGENKAEQIETKPQQQGIETMSSEDLAGALNQQYQTIMQCQNNILLINNVLEKRKKGTPK